MNVAAILIYNKTVVKQLHENLKEIRKFLAT
jgi:hypothetical protein